MYLMLQQDRPDDFVIATGQTHSVREFCERAFARVGLDYRDYVVSREEFFRPSDVNLLAGQRRQGERGARLAPGVTFEELVDMMVDHDVAVAAGK